MSRESWPQVQTELQRNAEARGGGCSVNAVILEGEAEARYEYDAVKYAVNTVLIEHVGRSKIMVFSMGGASMQFIGPSKNLSVPLGINIGSQTVQENGQEEGARMWEQEARSSLQRSLEQRESSAESIFHVHLLTRLLSESRVHLQNRAQARR
jgi:hypothetical protein